MHVFKKKFNYEHAYLLFITVLALASLIGNAYQNHVIEVTDKQYQKLTKDYQDKENDLKIITDEYNDLLEKNSK